jgi:beta-glucosidase
VSSHGQKHAVSVRVTNTGARTGAEVVQLYVGYPRAANEPLRQLKGYAKIVLRPGETRRVTLRLRNADLAVWRTGDCWSVVPGRYRVLIGTSSRDIRAIGSLIVRR